MGEVVWKREAYDGGTRLWGAMVPLNGKLYIPTSRHTLHSFTPGDEQYTEVLYDSTDSRESIACLGDNLYWLGGYAKRLRVYNPSTGESSYDPDMPEIIIDSAPVAADGKIYVPGGSQHYSGSHAEDINTLHIYDVASKSWSEGASMNVPRCLAATVLVENKIYVFGGRHSNLVTHQTAEVYDIATDTWSFIRELPVPIKGAGAASLNGKIYICGGLNADGYRINTLWIYDIASDTYAEGPKLPETTSSGVAAILDGRLYYDAWEHLYSLVLDDTGEPDPGPGPNPSPEPEPGNGCLKAELKLTGCTNNSLFRDVVTLITNSECECDCDCSCK